jgi:hypothetical protein
LYLKIVNERCQYGYAPVPKKSAWERFNSGKPRRLLIKVAAPSHVDFLDDEARPVAAGIADIGQALRAPHITVDISMGHRKGELDRGMLVRVIKECLGLGDSGKATVETLSVGVSDGESNDLIDFLEEYLVVKDRLDLPDGDPDRHYSLRSSYLEQQFNANLEYISSTYGP